MATKSGELREILVSSIEDVRAKRIDATQAAAIAKLASAISQSVAIELKTMEAGYHEGRMGDQRLGEEIEADRAVARISHDAQED
jgi:methyl coenzyme M reductase beta subunit